jgi:hypothetical protein
MEPDGVGGNKKKKSENLMSAETPDELGNLLGLSPSDTELMKQGE